MDNDQHLVTERLIRDFEHRSKVRAAESYLVLALMLALVSLAGWIFVNAKEITTRETKQDIQSALVGLQKKKDDATARVKDLATDLKPILGRFGEIRPTEQQSNPAKFHLNLTSDTGRLRPYADLAAELENDLKRTGYNFIDYEVRIKDTGLPGFRVRVVTGRVPPASTIVDWPQLDLSDSLGNVAPSVHEVEIADSAITQLLAGERNKEVQTLLGRDPEGQNVNLSIPFLIQLNVTRFGTITLVAIALGILSPLYRFAARLAAYYQARADALRLHQHAYRQTSVLRIIDAFTPQFDFAAAQSGNDRIADLVKLIADDSKASKG